MLWLRLPRDETTDTDATQVLFSAGGGLVLINRDDYWQAAVLVAKGQAQQALGGDGPVIRDTISALAPYLSDRAEKIRPADVSVLSVRLDRLCRWSAAGVLCIGDAAHAMSPVGGVGINLAIQDAVATARLLAPALRRGSLTERDLRAVRRRRWLPTAMTQLMQRGIHRYVISPIVVGTGADTGRRLKVPFALKLVCRFPLLRALPARLVGFGVRPEHATGVLATPLAPSLVGEHRVGDVADPLDRD